MRSHILFWVLLCIAFFSCAESENSNSFEKEETKLRQLLTEYDDENQEERDVFDLMAEDEASEEDEEPEVPSANEDPCEGVRCGAGRACYINDVTRRGECQCIKDCGYEPDPRRKVCTNTNETFSSDCEVYQMRCLCQDGPSEKCSDPERFEHMHVDYFGECRSIPDCNPEEMVDFPRRMREWLFNVMKELSERRELSYHYLQMEKEAEDNRSKSWANAAIWKWCDLDKHPHDNVVSRHELFPIRAPLQALEHCIGDFLDTCDSDDDHEISLKEWGKCLEIDETDLKDKCEKINEES